MPNLFQITLTALLLFVWSATAQADKRVALVIGNSSYTHVSSLPNPQNDAADLAALLERVGFKVRRESNLGRHAMQDTLAEFSDTAAGADMALIFYAGHGIGVDKQNFLIPVDARLSTDRKIRFETVPLDTVLASMDGVKGVRIVLLDACRNNPFAARMKLTSSSRSVSRGFSRVEPSRGTLISFAAKDGTTADDGSGRNSPYTAALLKHLDQPGLELQFMFRKVRDQVLAATGGGQEPFTYGSLPGRQIYLSKPPGTTEGTSGGQSTIQIDREALFWSSIKDSRSVDVIKTYLAQFPSGQFSDLARAKIIELKKSAKVQPGNEISEGHNLTRKFVGCSITENSEQIARMPGKSARFKIGGAMWAARGNGKIRRISANENEFKYYIQRINIKNNPTGSNVDTITGISFTISKRQSDGTVRMKYKQKCKFNFPINKFNELNKNILNSIAFVVPKQLHKNVTHIGLCVHDGSGCIPDTSELANVFALK